MKVYSRSHNSQRPFRIAAASLVIVLTFVLIGAVQSRAAVVFSQDFESGLGPNETTSGAFQINNTNSNLNNGTLMMGHPSFYGNNEYSFYEVTLDLTNFEQVELQFDFNANFETHFDRFNLQAGVCPISPPNDLIEPVSGMTYISSDTHKPELGTRFFDTGSEKSGTAVFDLSAFDLQANVCARFQFGSDGSVTRDGINLDNILITGSSACAAIDAIDDQFSVINDGATADFSVLANDECSGDPPISVVELPGDLLPDRGGSATTDGATVSYTPAAGFKGYEQFTYTAQDAGLQGDPPAVDQDTATVVVDVIEDLIPDAVDDAATTLQNQATIIDVLENDFLENAPVEVTIETAPASGSAALQADRQNRNVDSSALARSQVEIVAITVGHDVDRHLTADEEHTNRHGRNIRITIGVGQSVLKSVFTEEVEVRGVPNGVVGL